MAGASAIENADPAGSYLRLGTVAVSERVGRSLACAPAAVPGDRYPLQAVEVNVPCFDIPRLRGSLSRTRSRGEEANMLALILITWAVCPSTPAQGLMARATTRSSFTASATRAGVRATSRRTRQTSSVIVLGRSCSLRQGLSNPRLPTCGALVDAVMIEPEAMVNDRLDDC